MIIFVFLEIMLEQNNLTDSPNLESYDVERSITNSLLYRVRHHRIIKVMDLFSSKYDCKVCRKKLRYKADEIIHGIKHKSGPTLDYHQIKCPYCFEEMRTYFQLGRHLMIKHLNERPYGCRLCKKKFHAFVKLKNHCFKYHLSNSSDTYFDLRQSPSSVMSSVQSITSSFQDIIEYENSHLSLESANHDLNNNIISTCTNNLSYDFFNEETTTALLKSPVVDMFTIITRFNCQQCAKCDQQFTSSSDYLIHCWNSHMHSQEHLSTCWLCAYHDDQLYHYEDDLELKKHLLEEHLNEEYEFKCSLCSDKLFLNPEEASEHYLQKHAAFRSRDELRLAFACFSCEKIYFCQRDIHKHFAESLSCSSSGDMRYKHFKCCEDAFIFNSQKAYEIHMYQHRYLDSFHTCQTISKINLLYRKTPIFKRNKSLILNTDLIARETQNWSDLNSYSKSGNIKNFLVTNHSQSQVINVINKRESATSSDVVNINHNTTISNKKFKCEYCEYSQFQTMSDLSLHVLEHKSTNFKRPFKCHLCSLTFVKMVQLKRHMIVHQAGELDFVCQICFSSFSRRQDLDRHLLFHSK